VRTEQNLKDVSDLHEAAPEGSSGDTDALYKAWISEGAARRQAMEKPAAGHCPPRPSLAWTARRDSLLDVTAGRRQA